MKKRIVFAKPNEKPVGVWVEDMQDIADLMYDGDCEYRDLDDALCFYKIGGDLLVGMKDNAEDEDDGPEYYPEGSSLPDVCLGPAVFIQGVDVSIMHMLSFYAFSPHDIRIESMSDEALMVLAANTLRLPAGHERRVVHIDLSHTPATWLMEEEEARYEF